MEIFSPTSQIIERREASSCARFDWLELRESRVYKRSIIITITFYLDS